jgi:hypothetical protein
MMCEVSLSIERLVKAPEAHAKGNNFCFRSCVQIHHTRSGQQLHDFCFECVHSQIRYIKPMKRQEFQCSKRIISSL